MSRGWSIHIGLNSVDPDSYEGWAGPLSACEFDAGDMAVLAESQGFETRTILTREATAINVIGALQQAAAVLQDGDILFLSYSGHGGQVDDANGDEKDLRDETWVLYDRQLLDDELYDLWSRFRPGVRIVVVSDSCHSGTVVRGIPDYLQASVLQARYGGMTVEDVDRGTKAMPEKISRSVNNAHRDLYDGIQRALKTRDGAAIGAGVLLISGCMDNQLSADGERNGRFTEELLRVWNTGKFEGSYRSLHKTILMGMPPDQSPNLLPVGTANPEFEQQRPFSIELFPR